MYFMTGKRFSIASEAAYKMAIQESAIRNENGRPSIHSVRANNIQTLSDWTQWNNPDSDLIERQQGIFEYERKQAPDTISADCLKLLLWVANKRSLSAVRTDNAEQALTFLLSLGPYQQLVATSQEQVQQATHDDALALLMRGITLELTSRFGSLPFVDVQLIVAVSGLNVVKFNETLRTLTRNNKGPAMGALCIPFAFTDDQRERLDAIIKGDLTNQVEAILDRWLNYDFLDHNYPDTNYIAEQKRLLGQVLNASGKLKQLLLDLYPDKAEKIETEMFLLWQGSTAITPELEHNGPAKKPPRKLMPIFNWHKKLTQCLSEVDQNTWRELQTEYLHLTRAGYLGEAPNYHYAPAMRSMIDKKHKAGARVHQKRVLVFQIAQARFEQLGKIPSTRSNSSFVRFINEISAVLDTKIGPDLIADVVKGLASGPIGEQQKVL